MKKGKALLVDRMFGLMLLGVVALSSGNLYAETWIARCNNLQFNFNRTAKTYLLYFKTSAGIFQMGTGTITFDNGTALRGPLSGNAFGTDGAPITEIGLNPSRNLVYVLYRHPTEHTTQSGDFCTTAITRVN
jgi:hypothetical protein